MKIRNLLKSGFLVTVLSGLAVAAAGLYHAPPVEAGQERRPPPKARRAGIISEPVRRDFTRIQEAMFPEEEEGAQQDLPRAKQLLDELMEDRYERMNDFEKASILNLYTSYYVSVEDFVMVVDTFHRLLELENLREDFQLRALRSLGQLSAMDEDWRTSIDYYNQWREISELEDALVFRGLGAAYYQLGNVDRAVSYWIDYMNLSVASGRAPSRGDYNFLRGAYYTQDRFRETLDIVETMTVLFDEGDDWKNLSPAYSLFEGDDYDMARLGVLDIAYTRGFFDDDDERLFLNLGQTLGGRGMPYSGAKVIQRGLDREVVEPTVENFAILARMYTAANMFDRALEPARRAAELDETGNSADTVGYLQYILGNNEDAVESFREAVDKGELDNPAETLLYLARALMGLREYEDALEAAQEALEAADTENIEKTADRYMGYINNRAERNRVLTRRREAVMEYFEDYPPLPDL